MLEFQSFVEFLDWECPTCTVRNLQNARTCIVCNKRRPYKRRSKTTVKEVKPVKKRRKNDNAEQLLDIVKEVINNAATIVPPPPPIESKYEKLPTTMEQDEKVVNEHFFAQSFSLRISLNRCLLHA